MDIHTLFIHLAIEGHLSCFQLGAIVNKAAINIHVQSPCRHTFLFLLGTFLGVVLVIIQAVMLIWLQKKLLGMFIFYEQVGRFIFPLTLEGLMLKLKLKHFGHLMWRVDSLEKADAGRDWGQEEKGTTEDEMVGWHHRFDGHEFE